MAIQVRRGNLDDLDTSKLRQGEPFITLDQDANGYYVGVAIAPNNVVRLATQNDLIDIKEDCEDARDEAVASAENAADSESNAEAWAVGERGGVPVTSGDDTYENNSKYYAELAKEYEESAAAIVGIGIATTTTAGIVKPDGTSITIDSDGTIHSTGGTGTIDNAFAVVDVGGTELEADGEDKLTLTAGTGISLTPNASDNSVEISATGGGGGLLPHFYITSEAGSTVTVTTPDGSTITPTLVSAGNWECDVPSYGAYTVTSVYNGDTATFTVNVDDVKEYQIAANHFEYTIYVTAPNGSSIRVADAGNTDVHTGTGTGSALAIAVHKKTTVYTITVTIDGVSKSDTVTTGSTSGGSSSVTIQFGTINLTLAVDFIGETITCVNGGTTISKTASSTSMVFSVPTTGTWVISGTISGQTYSVNAVVSSLSTPVSVTLETIPDGSTVTPTDDIQIWLNCAGIYDKTSYTTLADVLADHDTLQRVISDENATDYLVRSKTWINKNIIPAMTSETSPSGQVDKSAENSTCKAWMAFNLSEVEGWLSQNSTPYIQSNAWVSYEFTSPQIVRKASAILCVGSTAGNTVSGKIQAYDGSNWVDVSEVFSLTSAVGNTLKYADVNTNGNSYSKYRWICTTATSTNSTHGLKLQLYTYPNGITEDATAMRYIGKRNYAANTLLADEDWYDAIQSSDYYESVTGSQVPIMTDDTHPSGEVVYSTLYSSNQAYWAFDGNVSTVVNIQNQVGSYIGYIFDHPVLLTRIFVDHQGSNHSTSFKLQYTDDGTNWSDLDVSWTLNSATSAEVLIPYSTTKHLGYRVMETVKSASWNWMPFASITFYGRSDVSEDYIDIYSAASDTVYYLDNGSPVTVCTTDTSGYGTVSRSSLPAGTYTLYSTVADNPSNLSADYSKSIDVHDYNIELYVMPENALYWYGYIDDNCETISTANGWTVASSTGTPVYNTNSVRCTASSNQNTGIGNKNSVTVTQINTICKGVTAASGQYGQTGMSSDKNISTAASNYGATWYTNSSLELVTYTPTLGNTGFIRAQAINTRAVDISALWYE